MNMKRSIKTGIIGGGKIGRVHAQALLNLAESSLITAYGRNPARTAAFAGEFGIRACPTIAAMAGEGTEAVIICTPHPNHAEAAVQAMEAGMHVLVEKPLASSLADCDAMIRTAREKGVLLGTVSQRRFYPSCQRIRQAIDQGRIGRTMIGTVHMLGWRDDAYYRMDPWRGTWEGEGGGVLVNQAPHQLDLLRWYMGPIDEVFAYAANLNHPYIEVEDTAVAVVRFKNGGLGQILVSNSVNPALYGKVHIHGSNGATVGVQTDGGAMFIAGVSGIAEPPVNDLWTIPGEEGLLETWKKEDTEFFGRIDPVLHFCEQQDADFLQAVLRGNQPLVTAEDGRNAVEIFTAIYRSSRNRAPVRFPLEADPGADFDGRYVIKG